MKFLWVTHAQIPMPIKIRATFQNKLRPTEHHQWACHGLDSPEHRRRWQGPAGQPACGWQRPAAASCPPRSLRWSSGIKACPVPCCLGAGSCSRSWWLAAGKTPVNNVRIMKILTCLSFQKKMLWTCPKLFPSTILKVTSFYSGMPGVLRSDILVPPTWGTKDYLINPWFLNIYLSFLLFLQTPLFSLSCEHDETPGAGWLTSWNLQNLMNGGVLNVVSTF